MTPYDAFVVWFKELPLKYQQDLVSEFSSYLPGIDVNAFHREFLNRFVTQLETIRKRGMAAELGLVVCLSALMDQFIKIHLLASESAAWKKEQAALSEMAKLTGSCSLAEHASAKLLHTQEWQAIASAWEQLKSQWMTDDCMALNYPITV